MVRIYTFTKGPAEFLGYQKATFDGFVREEAELIVVNDGQSPEALEELDAAARRLSLRCVRTALPACGDPSIGLAAAMEFALRELVRGDDDLSLFVHGDVFACRRFSLHHLFGDADVLAFPERKRSADGSTLVHYPWSGVVGLRPAALPDPETIGFGPGEVDGVRVDTGGMFALYAARHPELRLRALDKVRVSARSRNGALMAGGDPALLSGRGMDLVAGVLMHYLGGSGWLERERAAQPGKRAATRAFLDRLLESGSGLATLAPAASRPWPGRSS